MAQALLVCLREKSVLFLVLLIVASSTQHPSSSRTTGKFWQVSDFHYDPKYSTSGDTAQMCHAVGKPSSPAPGEFGDYLCDAPWRLVEEAVRAMAKIESSPDFIIWTGDDPPHVPVSTLNFDIVLEIVKNSTQLIKEHFPTTRVFPALGNHDYFPKGQMPPEKNPFYEAVGQLWFGGFWIPEGTARSTFENYGYYTTVLAGNPPLRFVCVNTVYYYHQDKVTENMTDPGDQFDWFDEVMDQARSNGERVYVFGHVPPGMFERKANISWFYTHYNSLFLEVMANHSDIIAAQFFAHQHADSFKVFYKDCNFVTGDCKEAHSSMFLAPSVTPWKTTLPGVSAQNPAIRVYEYDKKTYTVTTIRQYHADLTTANRVGRIDWTFGYSAAEEYNLVDLSTGSLDCLLQSFQSSDSQTFDSYYKHNTAGFANNTACSAACKRTQACSIARADYDNYYRCQDGVPAWPSSSRSCSAFFRQTSSSKFPVYGYVLIAVAAVAILLHVLVVLVLKLRKKKTGPGYQPLLADESSKP